MAKAKKMGRPRLKDRKLLKEHVLTFRANTREFEDIQKAANLYGWTPREFYKNVIMAMTEKALAKEKKGENRIITLSPR